MSRNQRFTTLANKVTERASEAGIKSALNETVIINSGNPKNVTPTVCNVPVNVKTISTLSIGTEKPRAMKDIETTETSQIKPKTAQTAGLNQSSWILSQLLNSGMKFAEFSFSFKLKIQRVPLFS